MTRLLQGSLHLQFDLKWRHTWLKVSVSVIQGYCLPTRPSNPLCEAPTPSQTKAKSFLSYYQPRLDHLSPFPESPSLNIRQDVHSRSWHCSARVFVSAPLPLLNRARVLKLFLHCTASVACRSCFAQTSCAVSLQTLCSLLLKPTAGLYSFEPNKDSVWPIAACPNLSHPWKLLLVHTLFSSFSCTHAM